MILGALRRAEVTRPAARSDRLWGVSQTLWAVIVGGLLTGLASIGAQVLAARIQAKSQREAWKRDQTANQLAKLDDTYLGILRCAHQIENAVESWETGTLMSTQAHGAIGTGRRNLEDANLVIALRGGPNDPAVGLADQLMSAADRYCELRLVSHQPPATADETAAQAVDVRAAASKLRSHLHGALQKANADAE